MRNPTITMTFKHLKRRIGGYSNQQQTSLLMDHRPNHSAFGISNSIPKIQNSL
jgi:hypothetical protein